MATGSLSVEILWYTCTISNIFWISHSRITVTCRHSYNKYFQYKSCQICYNLIHSIAHGYIQEPDKNNQFYLESKPACIYCNY